MILEEKQDQVLTWVQSHKVQSLNSKVKDFQSKVKYKHKALRWKIGINNVVGVPNPLAPPKASEVGNLSINKVATG